MNKTGKLAGILIVAIFISVAYQRGPNQENWGGSKQKKNHMEKQK